MRFLPLAGLVLAGSLKQLPGVPALPADIAVIAGVVVAIQVASAVLRGTQPNRQSLFLSVLIVGTWVLGSLANSPSPYGIEKMQRLFTLSLLALLSPPFLIRTPRELHQFLITLASLSGGIAIIAVPYIEYLPSWSRFAIDGGSTLLLGRVAGAALVAVLALSLSRRSSKLLLIAALPLLYVLMGTAVQGAVAGVVVALGVIAMVRISRGLRSPRSRSDRLRWRLAMVFVVLSLGGAVFAGAIGDVRWERLTSTGKSESVRLQMYEASLELIAEQPFGVGWGNFRNTIAPYPHAEFSVYPHNIWLEVGVEAGWIALLVMVLATAYALRSAVKYAIRIDSYLLVGLLGYWLANAGVSGDINGNRAALVLVIAAIQAPLLLREGQPAGVRRVHMGGRQYVAVRQYE